jgi:hypothetical protein
MKNCCALRLLIRWAKRDVPQERFTCSGCGQSYIWKDYAWQPISTVQDIQDMMAEEHARQKKDATR